MTGYTCRAQNEKRVHLAAQSGIVFRNIQGGIMRHPVFVCLCGLIVLNASAAAGVYRCVGDAGEPEFRQQPCGTTAMSSGPSGSASVPRAEGLRPAERSWLKTRERDKRRASDKRSSRSTSGRAAKAQQQAYRCLRKRRALDAVSAELRRGYKPARGDSLRRRQRAYRDYLDAFCS